MATVPVDLSPTATPGGLLAAAGSLPGGWERGIGFLDSYCLAPTVMGECPTGDGLKPTDRPESAEFRPVSLIMAVECTTLGSLDVGNVSARELDRTRSFALAREMLTGAASARDASDPEHANPSLVGTAVDLGATFTTSAAMLECLEQQIAEATSGRGAVLLASPAVATGLLAENLLWRDGARWRTAWGSQVIVDAGFDGRAPGSAAPPAAGAAAYLYAVADVWAGVGRRDVYDDVNRLINTASARAEDVALAAFPTCAVFAAASTAVTVC